LISNTANPTSRGTSIRFTTSASGGTGSYQFKWWVFDGASWSVAQDWSTSTSMTWRPETAGAYMVAVWVRNAGVTADASQGLAQMSYVITP
jgi:hypothetical protein